jgi:hypothetical protein
MMWWTWWTFFASPQNWKRPITTSLHTPSTLPCSPLRSGGEGIQVHQVHHLVTFPGNLLAK